MDVAIGFYENDPTLHDQRAKNSIGASSAGNISILVVSPYTDDITLRLSRFCITAPGQPQGRVQPSLTRIASQSLLFCSFPDCL